MHEGLAVEYDILNDAAQDAGSSTDGGAMADYGGDLSSNAGVDLNAGTEFSGMTEKEPEFNDFGEDLNNADSKSIDSVLDNFRESNWSDLSMDEQKNSITDLANHVAADTGNKNPPGIDFREDMPDGTYGGYSPDSNTIEINVNMLDDAVEAADTIAHEMWHAYQEQAAKDPNNPRAAEYQEGFDNYISPEYDFEGYENQMVEAEAREYAQGIKDRLAGLKGAA